MKYAKFKGGHHYFMVNDKYEGISVYINGDRASISIFKGGARWFGKMYEAITESEFLTQKAAAQHTLDDFFTNNK